MVSLLLPSLSLAASELVDLGNGRYQLGAIQIDKPGRSFSVSGSTLRDEPPLEYVAVKKGGAKAYESLFELDVTATEFNLACILIGLSVDKAVLSEFHSDARPPQGDPVKIEVEWMQNGVSRRASPEQMFVVRGETTKPAGDWVYTGSIMHFGSYLAEDAGTLIGFIHDPASIIEHRAGIGLGKFGLVTVDADVAPAVGTEIRLIVTGLVTSPTR